ncbi:unnamed protein product [Brassica oleracea]
MESPEAVSSVFLPLPPEPPDPDLDVMLLVDHPVPPVPPHPPPILIDASVLSVKPLLMHPLLAEADLSSSLTTRRVSLLHLVSKPRNLVSCGEHVSFKSSLRKVSYYQQEAGVIEISVARFLGLLTADCKFTRHFKFSRTGLRMLKFWRWWVFCKRFFYLSATFWSAALYCYVQFSVKAYPSFETLVTCCWTHLPLLHAFARFEYLAMVARLTAINFGRGAWSPLSLLMCSIQSGMLRTSRLGRLMEHGL